MNYEEYRQYMFAKKKRESAYAAHLREVEERKVLLQQQQAAEEFNERERKRLAALEAAREAKRRKGHE